MKFSVVIPSFLGSYSGAASRRDEKLVRAVQSVLDQTFQDFEIQVVADGCQQTVELMKQFTDERVHVTLYPSSYTGQQPIQNIERESIKRDAQTHR